MPETKKRVLLRRDLKAKLDESISGLDSISRQAQSTLKRVNRGKTDKGNAFERVWRDLKGNFRDLIDDAPERIATKDELLKICKVARQYKDGFQGEFELTKTGTGPVKALLRDVRAELRRVQGWISDNYELADSDSDDDDEEEKADGGAVADDDNIEEGGGEDDPVVELSPKELMVFGRSKELGVEDCVEYLLESFSAHVEGMFGRFADWLMEMDEGKGATWDFADEEIGREDFEILETFVGQLSRLSTLLAKMATAKFTENESWEVGEFVSFMEDTISTIKPYVNHSEYGDLYQQGHPIVRKISEFYGRLLNEFRAFSVANDLYKVTTVHRSLRETGFDSRRIFLTAKYKHILDRELAEQLSLEMPDYEQMSLGEKRFIEGEWKELRSDHGDVLNNQKRKQIANAANDRFHGGIGLRTSGSLRPLLEALSQEEADRIARAESDRDASQALILAVFEDLRVRTEIELLGSVCGFLRGEIEFQQEAEEGGVIFMTGRDYSLIEKAVSKMVSNLGKHFGLYIEASGADIVKAESFLNGESRVHVDDDIRVELSKVSEVLSELEFVDEGRLREYLENIKIGTALSEGYLAQAGEIAAHQVPKPQYSFDVEVGSVIWGPLAKFIDDERFYTGPIMDREEQSLTAFCLGTVPPEVVSHAQAVAIIEEADLISQFAELINDELYGGQAIRSEETVREFVSVILLQIISDRRREQGESNEIGEELMRRIVAIRVWYEGVPVSNRFANQQLKARMSMLRDEVIESLPVREVLYYVEKVEVVMNKAKSGASLSLSFTDSDHVELILYPAQERFGSVEHRKVGVRQDDLKATVTRLDERIEYKKAKREELRELLARRAALKEEEETLVAWLGLYDGVVRARYAEIGQVYSAAAAAPGGVDAGVRRKVAVIESEIDALSTEKDQKERQIAEVRSKLAGDDAVDVDAEGETSLNAAISLLRVEVQGLDSLVRQRRREQQKLDVIEEGLAALLKASFANGHRDEEEGGVDMDDVDVDGELSDEAVSSNTDE